MSLFRHRFKEKAIYLLDEPEAALSPARQLAFLRVIHDLVKGGIGEGRKCTDDHCDSLPNPTGLSQC